MCRRRPNAEAEAVRKQKRSRQKAEAEQQFCVSLIDIVPLLRGGVVALERKGWRGRKPIKERK